MKYRIRYRMYDKRGLIDGVSEVEACDFEIKKGLSASGICSTILQALTFISTLTTCL